MKLNHNKSFVVYCMLLVLVSSCRTSGKEDLGGGIFSSIDNHTIVIRSGSKSPSVSPRSRLQWVEQQKSEVNEIRKTMTFLALGDPLSAERQARSYLLKKPGSADATLALASSLAQSRQYDLAAYYASLVKGVKKYRANALNIIGLAQLMNANSITEYRVAEQTLMSAHKGDTTQIAAGLNLGNMYLELGNAASASNIFQSTSVRCGKCADALLGYGIASQRNKKPKQAESAFKMLISSHPSHARARYHLALLYSGNLNNKKKAKAQLLKIADSDVAGSSTLKQRAQALLSKLQGEKDYKVSKFLDLGLGGDNRTEAILTGKN